MEDNIKLFEDFLREASVMRQLNHSSVLCMFGVSIHNNLPCVILPLMSNGDLKNYLVSHKTVSIYALPFSQHSAKFQSKENYAIVRYM